MSPFQVPFSSDGPQDTLVKNRRAFGGKDVTFSIYDPPQPARHVSLRSPHPMYCGMITGKNVVHVGPEEPFEFFPGESLVVPPLEEIHIDVPKTDSDRPTTCVTLEIDRRKVDQLLDRFDETVPPAPTDGFPDLDDLHYIHFDNPAGLERAVQSLVFLFTADDLETDRDVLVDLNAAELVLRLLQTRARVVLTDDGETHTPDHGLAAAVQHVHRNLDRHVTVDELAERACMSTSTFYRHFRSEFGVTPLRYVTACRMRRAQALLREGDRTVTAVCYDLGFSSISHFISKFKEHVGTTPKCYQREHADESPPVSPERVGPEETSADAR